MSWYILGTCRRCNRTLSVAECPTCQEPLCSECAVHHKCPLHPFVGPAAEAAAAYDDLKVTLPPEVEDEDMILARRVYMVTNLIVMLFLVATTSWALVRSFETNTQLQTIKTETQVKFAVVDAERQFIKDQLSDINKKLDRALDGKR